MATKLFINRIKERSFFQNDLQKSQKQSRIIIISAATGIGKSSLVDQVIKETNYDLDHRVRIKQSESEDCDYGFFLKKIIKLIDINALNSQGFYVRFHEFVIGKKGSELIGEAVVKKFLSPIGGDDYLIQRKSDEEKTQQWLGNELDLLILGKQYIEYVFKTRKIILAIENVQNMDNYSARIILDILQSTTNAYFYFEYTTECKYNHSISDLCNYFQVKLINVSDYVLKKLDKREIVQTLKNREEVIIGILNSTYEKSDGNLFKLSLLLNDSGSLNLHKDLTYNETIRNLIFNLNDSLKILLLVIESHKGIISYSILNQFIITYLSDIFDYNKLDSSLEFLSEYNLIEYSSNEIKISHDSLFQELNRYDELKKYYVIILRKLCNYYLEKNQEKTNIEELINNYLYLISFYLRLNSYPEIIDILKQININLASFPINKVISYIDLIRITYNENKQDDEFDEELDQWLTFIYFRCGYFDKIISNFSYSNIHNNQMELCYLAALSSEEPQKALDLLKKKNYKIEIYDLGLKLVKLRALRSLRKVHECYDLWFNYYKNNVFKDTPWEGDFLRYSCLCIHDDLDFRINQIEKAYNFFVRQNNSYGIITSCLTLARDYAYIQENIKALNWMNQAKNHIQNSVFPMYQFYNNQSVMEILNHNVSGKTLLNLYKSLDICTNTDDIISIKSNLLCCYILQGNSKGGINLFSDLLETLYKKYHHNSLIMQSVIYNCYKYAVILQDKENFEFLKKHYDNLEKYYEKGNILLSSKKCHSVPSIIQEKCYPVLMVNWDVDYYNVLNNYQ